MTDTEAVLASNALYYRAFGAGDMKTMADVWGMDDITCVHPGWPLLDGRDDVLASFAGILSNPAQDAVGFGDERVIVSGDMARVMCVETVGGGMLAATNLFARTPLGWRMVHHQASPIAIRKPSAPRTLN